MKHEELYKIYEDISNFIYDNSWRSYHTWYTCGSAEIISDGTIEFLVYGTSDQGDGDDWIEHWSIGTNGKIYAEGNVYNNIEDFKIDW